MRRDFANDSELRGILDGGFRGERNVELLVSDEFGIGHRLRIARRGDHGVLDRQARYRHVELFRSQTKQRLPGSCGRLPKWNVYGGDAVGGARAALIGSLGGVAKEHIDAIERHIELLRGHHGPGGRRTLAVIHLPNFDDDGPVTVNLDERVHGFQVKGGIVRSDTFFLRGFEKGAQAGHARGKSDGEHANALNKVATAEGAGFIRGRHLRGDCSVFFVHLTPPPSFGRRAGRHEVWPPEIHSGI